MRLSGDEKKRFVKERRERWKAEVEHLKNRQFEREQEEVLAQKNRATRWDSALEKVLDKLASDEFQAWYEVTTGESVVAFLARMMGPISDWERGLAGCVAKARLDRIQSAIECVTESNPWTNPETKEFWINELIGKVGAERRKILIRLATPRWANREEMMALYRRCRQVSRETGVLHHIDHIVPIISKVVCGLHCQCNLRIIPATDNQRKSNKFST